MCIAQAAFPFRECEVDDHSPTITLSDEPLEFLHLRLTPPAFVVDRRNIIVERAPRGPYPNPIETVTLHVVQIVNHELPSGSQCSVVADAVQKARFSVDRELSSGNLQPCLRFRRLHAAQRRVGQCDEKCDRHDDSNPNVIVHYHFWISQVFKLR